MLSFLYNQNSFQIFSWEHFLPIILSILIAFCCISIAKKQNESSQNLIGLLIGCIPLISIILSTFFRYNNGEASIQEDLPLHVCRVVAIISPLVLWKRNRYVLGILYFWIFAGTLNANITPDLKMGFPHYEYLCYFMLHSFLLVVPLYAIFVYKINITWTDFKRAFIGANLYMLLTLVVNFSIGSNYMYTKSKPPVETILDAMGPWPWYLITVQFLALILFLLLIIPFAIKKRLQTSSSL